MHLKCIVHGAGVSCREHCKPFIIEDEKFGVHY